MPRLEIVSPSQDPSSFECPRCLAYAQQDWSLMWVNFSGHDEWDEGEGSGDVELHTISRSYILDDLVMQGRQYEEPRWKTSHCYACKRPSLWRGEKLVYPTVARLSIVPHEDLPADAKELFAEASAVWVLSPRAGTALARAALEATLKELAPDANPRARLDDRIAAVAKKISSGLFGILTTVRHSGNIVLHHDSQDAIVAEIRNDDNGKMAEVILGAINELADELIARPREQARINALVPDSVTATAQRKATKAAGSD